MMIDQKKLEHLTENQPLSFEDAMYLLRVQKKVRRVVWQGNFNKTDPKYIYLKKSMSEVAFEPCFVDERGVKYRITTTDILTEDWMLV